MKIDQFVNQSTGRSAVNLAATDMQTHAWAIRGEFRSNLFVFFCRIDSHNFRSGRSGNKSYIISTMKIAFALSALVAGAHAFAPVSQGPTSTALFNGPELGAGGMADTRNPDAVEHEDPRKSISVAPSFEEYMKQRAGNAEPAAAAPAAPAPVAAAPTSFAPSSWAPSGGMAAAAPSAPATPSAPASTGGSDIVGTLSSLQGPGMVWGDQGVELGYEESELKGYDNFDKFFDALQSTGVAAELAAGGPYTVFAPTNSALETYEMLRGPIDANVVKMHIVPGQMASDEVRGDLNSLNGPLKYRYAVRKHFINDAIIGEKSFGPYPDFPIDVACSNGVIHAVGLCFALY